MSNWQTVRQLILDEADRPSDTTLAERAMCEALRYLRSLRFWWNEGQFEIYTTAEVNEYPLPPDFISLIGKVFYTKSGSTESRSPLIDKTIDWLEEYKYTGLEWNASELSGPPMFYAIRNKDLLISPIPDTADEKLDGRYLRDLGTPYELYNGSWNFYVPNSTVAIATTFTNEWFVSGVDMLKHRALYHLYDNFYKDDAQATRHMQKFMEAFNRARGETTRYKAARQVRPHM